MRRFKAACCEAEVCDRIYSCGGFNTPTLVSGVLIGTMGIAVAQTEIRQRIYSRRTVEFYIPLCYTV